MAAGAKWLMGAPVAEHAYAECAAGIARLSHRGSRAPGLAFILVGRDPASHLYVKRKRQAAGTACEGTRSSPALPLSMWA